MILRRNVDRKETGVDLIETRNSKYYRKYTYRARFELAGAGRTWGLTNLNQYKTRLNFVIADLQSNERSWGQLNATYSRRQLDAIALIDYQQIGKFLKWKKANANSKGKLRVEMDRISWFTEDIKELKTVEKWFKGKIEYTQADADTPMGLKYFAREPKHPYRVYLRNRTVTNQVRVDINKFIDDYRDTSTVVVPSPALTWWLDESKSQWNRHYIYDSYFIDFDDESTLMLMGMMFGDLLGLKFKCEKRPEAQD